ncbi:calcium-dependent phosphotriesterase superfamily protein, partial [Striga asiatica]
KRAIYSPHASIKPSHAPDPLNVRSRFLDQLPELVRHLIALVLLHPYLLAQLFDPNPKPLPTKNNLFYSSRHFFPVKLPVLAPPDLHTDPRLHRHPAVERLVVLQRDPQNRNPPTLGCASISVCGAHSQRIIPRPLVVARAVLHPDGRSNDPYEVDPRQLEPSRQLANLVPREVAFAPKRDVESRVRCFLVEPLDDGFGFRDVIGVRDERARAHDFLLEKGREIVDVLALDRSAHAKHELVLDCQGRVLGEFFGVLDRGLQLVVLEAYGGVEWEIVELPVRVVVVVERESGRAGREEIDGGNVFRRGELCRPRLKQVEDEQVGV